MAKKPLSAAQLAQRRAAAKNGGRPSKPVSPASISRAARERVAVARARGIVKSVQVEVARTLIAGMRGMLPGSTAATMQDAAAKLAAKGGLHDVVANKLEVSGALPGLRISVEADKYPKPITRDDAGEDGSSLED